MLHSETESDFANRPLPLISNAPETARVIDQAIGVVCSDWQRVARALGDGCAAELSFDQLRDGPLGRDLFRIAAVADGAAISDEASVGRAIESTLQLLFWPAGSRSCHVPSQFWETELGSLFERALARSQQPPDIGQHDQPRLPSLDPTRISRGMDHAPDAHAG